MNHITVLDVLNLPIMANATLKAGHNGLSNIVSYVNVLDNYYDESKPEETPVNYGQNFYLTSFFYGVNNEAYIDSVMRHFIDVNISALCIIDDNLKELPQSAYDLADKHGIPIIFISADTPYALIISSIMELKLSYQDSELKENLLHELTAPQCSDSRKAEITHQLNPNLLGEVTAFFCLTRPDSDSADAIPNRIHFLDKIKNTKTAFACPYKGGIVVVKSFPPAKKAVLDSLIEETISAIHALSPETIIGISDPLPLFQLNEAVLQSHTAASAGSQSLGGVSHFKDIGISQFLLKMISHPELEAYCSRLLDPILKYDEKYNSSLLETMQAYIEHNLDHIKTGQALHIHQNTVRYRLNKIKELIPYGKSPLDFHFSIYFLYKILKIKELQ